jgi:hypothetical protein
MVKKDNLTMGGPLRHGSEVTADAELDKQARAHVDSQPGVRFLVDALTALHQGTSGLRPAAGFYDAFPPALVLEALAQRPDLRVKLVQSLTGGPGALLRRVPPAELAHQIELLAVEDLPVGERGFRPEGERTLPVAEIYLRRLDPFDVATYLPAPLLWQYESRDGWWNQEPTPGLRALMAAELKSVRRHQLLPDGELLDLIGDETMERDLPVAVRTRLRAAARKAGAEGRAFRDTDLITCVRSADGMRDLIDDLCEHLPLPVLRKVVTRAGEVLGITSVVASTPASVAAATPATVVAEPPTVVTSPPVEKTPPPTVMTSATPERTPPPARVTIAPLTTPAKPFAASTLARGKGAASDPNKTPGPILVGKGGGGNAAGGTVVDKPGGTPAGQRPTTRPSAVTAPPAGDPFGFGPPVEEDVLQGMDDFAVPSEVGLEESTENR